MWLDAEHPSVTLFREYLRIKTVHPTPDYYGAAAFLKSAAEKKGLKYQTHECVAGKPFVCLLRLFLALDGLISVAIYRHLTD